MARCKLVIAVDFDDTIVEGRFPNIGDPLPGAIDALRAIVALGHKIVLNTCRENTHKRKYLDEAVSWLGKHGIPLRSVNETHPDDDFRAPPVLSRKIHADIFVDDKNIGGFPGWAFVISEIKKESQ